MKLLITAIALTVPTAIYIFLVRSVDRYEKEPPLYLAYAFIWGAVPAIIAALVLQIAFSIPVMLLFGDATLQSELVQAAVGAPVSEEILKGMAVALIYLTQRQEFDGWVDGMVYGAMAGFGFAYVENIFYLMGTSGPGGMGDAVCAADHRVWGAARVLGRPWWALALGWPDIVATPW
jgi:RsiW-degrading membrane proteinase PrsW (M82 family)